MKVTYEGAMRIVEQADADQCFLELVEELTTTLGISQEAAKRTVRNALGYMAGYYDNETRERVERLFDCAHPIFGRIAVEGPPTAEQALRAGIAMGRAGIGDTDGES